MKLQKILKEVENKTELDALNQAMGDAFKTLGQEFETNKAEIEQEVNKSNAALNEALGVVAVIGFILALPRLIEIFVKGLNKLVSLFKKIVKPGEAKENESEMASRIIDFTHKWHKFYIKGVKYILKSSGVFDKAGIKGDASQNKAAEVVYYVIVAGLAVYSGIGSVTAFKQALSAKGTTGAAGFSLSAFEAAMASVKTGEVRDFLTKLGLKVVT